MKLSWYSAKLLYVCDVEGNSIKNSADVKESSNLTEYSIRIFKAKSEEEAKEKAKQIGLKNQHYYKNYLDEKVSWNFVKVVEIQDLFEDEVLEGIEVYSSMNRTE